MRTAALLITTFCVSCALGQLTWQRTYGGYSTEEGNSIIEVEDGYVVVGSTGSFGAGAGDIYVLKLMLDGGIAWSRVLGGVGVEQGKQVRRTSDGGFVVVGYTNSSGNGGYDGYMAKLTVDGWPVWERVFGGTGWDFIYSVVERANGGFLAAGETYSNGAGESDAWLVQVSDEGDLEWEAQYGEGGADFARALITCSGGGYVFVGGRTTVENEDAWVVRLDDEGEIIWTCTQGGDSLDVANAVVETSDGGFAVVGTTRSFNPVIEAFHFKIDNSGVLVWQRNWGQVNDQESFGVKELPDGRLLSTGYVTSGGSGGRDMFILFSHANGDFERGVSNGGDNGEGDEVGLSLAVTSDGGSIHCGSTTSFGFGPKDVYVVKTNDTAWTASTVVDPVFDPVAVEEIRPPGGMSLFPNPATTSVRLSAPFLRSATVTLIDPQGRAVRTWSAPVPPELELGGLAAGTYQLQVVGTEGHRMAWPLVIAGY